MRIAFLGSGAFGLPTLEALDRDPGFEIALVTSQPDRPAGRGLEPRPTPIAAYALRRGLPLRRPEDANVPEEIAALEAARPDALVVVAFGQKLSPALLGGRFAINLHASLLPRWRGAAPIARSIEAGDPVTGVCVISIAERMDAGLVYRAVETPIDPRETAAELHDRLAALGPEAIVATLSEFARGALRPLPQDESFVTRARKIVRRDTILDPATVEAVRARQSIHAFSPRPGCEVRIGAARVKLLRVRDEPGDGVPGTLGADGSIACFRGRIVPLEVQPAGGRAMAWDAFLRGARPAAGTRIEPIGEGA